MQDSNDGDCVDEKRSVASIIRTFAGWAITVAWLGLLIFWWSNSPTHFSNLWGDPHKLAEFAAGASGPLALLWLIIGYFQQSEELELQRRQLKIQANETRDIAKQSAKQAESLRGQELNLRRDVYLKIKRTLHVQQNVFASRVLKKIKRQVSTAEIWDQYSKGDEDVFFHRCASALIDEIGEFDGTVILNKGQKIEVQVFVSNFEFLLKEAIRADDGSEFFQREIEQSGMARLYAMFCCGIQHKIFNQRISKIYDFPEMTFVEESN